eukprot:2512673-Amphidinium_carterae.1
MTNRSECPRHHVHQSHHCLRVVLGMPSCESCSNYPMMVNSKLEKNYPTLTCALNRRRSHQTNKPSLTCWSYLCELSLAFVTVIVQQSCLSSSSFAFAALPQTRSKEA